MTNKIDKEELKTPDAFISLSDQVLRWLERHFALIATSLGAVLVIWLGWLGYSYFDSTREQKAAEAIYLAEAELKSAESKVRDERAKIMGEIASKGNKSAKSESVRPTDYTKDFAPSVEKIKSQIKAYSGTKVALIAALNLSYFLTQQKQFGEALAVLELPRFKPGQNDVVNGFWLMHRGMIFLENQKFDEAVLEYQRVLSGTSLKAFHPEAILKLGLAHEMKGDRVKAKDAYERLGREFPESEASNSARQYLRLLELNQPQQG